jgi:hypothetical protein
MKAARSTRSGRDRSASIRAGQRHKQVGSFVKMVVSTHNHSRCVRIPAAQIPGGRLRDCPDFWGGAGGRSLKDRRQSRHSSSGLVAGRPQKRSDPQCLDTPDGGLKKSPGLLMALQGLCKGILGLPVRPDAQAANSARTAGVHWTLYQSVGVV